MSVIICKIKIKLNYYVTKWAKCYKYYHQFFCSQVFYGESSHATLILDWNLLTYLISSFLSLSVHRSIINHPETYVDRVHFEIGSSYNISINIHRVNSKITSTESKIVYRLFPNEASLLHLLSPYLRCRLLLSDNSSSPSLSKIMILRSSIFHAPIVESQ